VRAFVARVLYSAGESGAWRSHHRIAARSGGGAPTRREDEMSASGGGGLVPAAVGALLAQAGGSTPPVRWLVIGALALVAVYLLVAAVRCALRLVGLAVLVVVAWLAWRWLA
jgi:hypothetical protein